MLLYKSDPLWYNYKNISVRQTWNYEKESI